MTGFVEAARREKLTELVKRGVLPFAYRFDRTGTVQAALERFREDDRTVHRLNSSGKIPKPHRLGGQLRAGAAEYRVDCRAQRFNAGADRRRRGAALGACGPEAVAACARRRHDDVW